MTLGSGAKKKKNGSDITPALSPMHVAKAGPRSLGPHKVQWSEDVIKADPFL